MTTNELIYDIKEYLMEYSDDTEYSNRYILYLWNTKRSKYLRQLLNDLTRKFDNIILQTLCMPLEVADPDTCGISYPCQILRTTETLPDLIELRSRSSLISAGPTDFTAERFKILQLKEVPFIFDKPYSNGIYAFQNLDNRLYIISKRDSHKLLECLSVTGLFEKPEDLKNFVNDCSETPSTSVPCFSPDDEYPMQSFLIDPIRSEILEQLLPRKQIVQDEINNADEQ